MESGSNRESKAAAGDEGVTSPGQEEAAAAAATAGEEAAVSPPAPAASSPRPYYECVFCKRGFTTAQALGGHMNIHRRDRAKPAARDSLASGGMASAVSRGVECYYKYRHLVTYPTYPAAASSTPTTPIAAAGSSSFSMHYPSMGSAPAAGLDAESPSSVSPRELSLFGEAARDHDLHLGLGHHHGMVGEGSRAPPEGLERPAGEPERELDLELRLGRRPWH